jgi:SAM-dependent methyltransferase
MKRSYWNRLADSFEDEIFDVFAHDQRGLITGQIRRHGSRQRTASDLGCGTGNFLPALSDAFREVIAVDLSPKCIARAKAKHSHRSNVSFLTRDLAKPNARLPKVDFALSVNAVISPSLETRDRMLDLIARHLRPGAHLALVVPSLESALFTDFRRIEWNLRDGLKPSAAVRTGFCARRAPGNLRLREGVVFIDDVPTKHFLEEELIAILAQRGLKTVEILKIEYSWKTEFADPPRWMRDPHPWDWLCIARRQ